MMTARSATGRFSWPTGGRLPAANAFGAAILIALGASPALGAAPNLEQFHPVGVQAGTTNSITAVGKFGSWPPKVWVDAPGIRIQPQEDAGKFCVTVDENAGVGPHLIRLYDGNGASAPRLLIVANSRQEAEVEPNDEFSQPQSIEALSSTVNGRLDKNGDVDSFALTLNAGQTLVASLEAHVLGSPVDAVLRLVDSRGVELALNHDNIPSLDPLLAWTAPKSGTYILHVFGFVYPATSDVRFTGGDACVYRLQLSHGAHVRYTVPLGVQREGRGKRRLFGWNLGSPAEAEFEMEGVVELADEDRVLWRSPRFANALALPVGAGPELLEEKLRNFPQRETLAPPFAVTGCIEKPGEEDRFEFKAARGESLLIDIQSASFGFPLDACLAIQDATGRELVRSDDGLNADPSVEWTAPEDGIFVATIRNVLHRAGADHLYRLSIRPAQPALKALIAESSFVIEPGKSIDLKIASTRLHGFKAGLTAFVKGLPADVTICQPGVETSGLALQLSALSDASPFSGPIQIFLREHDSQAVHAVRCDLTTRPKAKAPSHFPNLVIKYTEQFWLTVSPSAKDPSRAEPAVAAQVK